MNFLRLIYIGNIILAILAYFNYIEVTKEEVIISAGLGWTCAFIVTFYKKLKS